MFPRMFPSQVEVNVAREPILATHHLISYRLKFLRSRKKINTFKVRPITNFAMGSSLKTAVTSKKKFRGLSSEIRSTSRNALSIFNVQLCIEGTLLMG